MQTELDVEKKLLLWKTAIALQSVDGIETSSNLMEIAKQNIEGKISTEEAVEQAKKIDDENHANLVAARTFALLSSQDEFSLTQEKLCEIHAALFKGVVKNAGKLRKKNIAKKEWALDGAALLYPEADDVQSLLKKILRKESKFSFEGLEEKESAKHIAKFISEFWQVHPFEKFNTRAVAVFFIKYLEHFGFALNNETLLKNPVYFRNSLARAAYCDKERKIKSNSKYLEKLIENMLFNGENTLNYKAVHLGIDEFGVLLKEVSAGAEKAVEEQVESKPKKPRVKKQKATAKKKSAPKKKIAKQVEKTETEKIETPNKDIFGNDNPPDVLEPDMETGVVLKSAPTEIAQTESAPTPETTPYIPNDKTVAEICKKAKIECNEKTEKILAYLIKNKTITNSQARETSETSTETARKILVEFSEKGIVEIQGANRNRVYVLK